MKGSKLGTVLSFFLSFLLLIAEGITLLALWKLDMLPSKYFLLVAVVLLCVWGLIAILFFWPSHKTIKGRQITASILVLSIVAGCGAVSGVVSQLRKTIHSITEPETVITGFHVYVLANDSAKTIADTSGYVFGLADSAGHPSNQKALDEIQRQLSIQVPSTNYSSVPELVNALYDGEVNAIVMDSAYVDILADFDAYADFSNQTRLLMEITIEEDGIPTLPDASSPTTPPDDIISGGISEKPFVVYISGSDTRNPSLSKSRSDVNILVVVNPLTKQILMINTPRDYYIPNPAGNGVPDKLTHCGIYGVSCSMQALSDLYQIPVDYYAQINFAGFQTLIDAIGGIKVYSDVAFSTPEVTINLGINELNGAQALAFARERYSLPGGDNARGKNQMKVISAVIEKLTSGSTVISRYGSILESLQGMFQTDLGAEDISDLAKMQLSDMATWNILSYAVTGKGSTDITYSMPGQPVYVMHPNQQNVDYASALVKKVLNGAILNQTDILAS